MAYEMHWVKGPTEGDDVEEFARRSRFSASDSMMASLRHEMEQQGMIDPDRIPAIKLEGPGQLVTPEEVQAALHRSNMNPGSPLHKIPQEEWRKGWEAWLEFLSGAAQNQYGGFTVRHATLH